MPDAKSRNRCGRRSAFSTDIASTICARLEKGESLRGICRDPAMPAPSTVMRWLKANPEFQAKYTALLKARSGRVVRWTYCDEIVETICNRLAKGESLRRICGNADMPGRTTVFLWLRRYEEFRAQYATARELQAECLADEILEIADSAGRDPVEIAQARLRIDARKWLAARLAPRKYGNAIPAGDTETPIIMNLTPAEMALF